MKAAVARRYGSLEVEDVGESREPDATERSLVRVHATSLNAVDWYGLTGAPTSRAP